MKLSKTTIKELIKRYRAVLLKCAIMNAVLFIGIGTVKAEIISSGVHENEKGEFSVLEITGGTFQDVKYETTTSSSEGTLSISGGTFSGENKFSTSGSSAPIKVTGGTFTGENKFKAYISSDIEISGASFDGDVIFNASHDLTIGDGSNFNSSSEIEFEAGNKIKIASENGIKVQNAEIKAPEISGKMIINGQSMIGNFGNSHDKWGNVYAVHLDRFGGDVAFNGADLTLNGNTIAGAGNYMIDYTVGEQLIFIDAESKIPTDDEQSASADGIMNEIKKVNTTSKNRDDLSQGVDDAIEVPMDIGNLEGDSVQDVIDDTWDSGNSLTDEKLEEIENALNDAYDGNQTRLNTFSVNIDVKNSTITMNNTSSLVNASVAETKGNITIDNSTVTANGTNTISAAKGAIAFINGSNLIVGSGATLSIFSKDNNKVSFNSDSTLKLLGRLNGNVEGTNSTIEFNSAGARLNGILSGTVNLKFNDNYVYSNINASGATVDTITIATGKTLDVGEGTLTASTITGGVLKAILTDAAKSSAIITANADNVTLTLDMSKASRDVVNLYHITDGTGFTFGDYSASRYAISSTEFSLDEAKTIGVLDGWTGGDLYILRLATASEAAVEDLKSKGVSVSKTEEKAIVALNDEVIEQLGAGHKANAQKINNMLEAATNSGNVKQMKQILREVAPEAAPSASQTAVSTAGAVISVVGTRMSGGSPTSSAQGRSSGDYTVGATSVWAQGMYNKAKLNKNDGFDSDSTGFATGFEYNITDSIKAGIGYAFTKTDIDTDKSKTDVDTHTGFIYGEYKPNDFYVNGVLSYGHSRYDEKTKLMNLKSDYRANTLAGQLMTGYTFGIFTPEAGVRYTRVQQRSYTDALGARMRSKNLDTWTGVAGLKASKSFNVGQITITPDAKVAMTYDLKRDDQNRMVGLANGTSYVAKGDNLDRFGIEAGAGVSVNVGQHTEIGLSYEGKFKDHYTDHTGLVNVKYNF